MYKAELPEITVNQIQKILSDLGIETNLTFFEIKEMSWSCRLQIVGRFQSLGIGVNGKGMTKAYASASAYGELMERIQNKLIVFTTKYVCKDFQQKNNQAFNETNNQALPFRYFPDEKTKSIDIVTLDKWIQKLLPEHSRLNTNDNTSYRMSFVPYKDLTTNNDCCIPYDLIRYAAGSTGMCAGNIPSEAILQGIFEIIERYVLQQIYLEKPILPAIPLSDFSGTEIADRINRMKKDTGWHMVVKDCSLGKGYPVLGLLIIDDKNDKYTFRIGSDIKPEIALQRCFTEIFQGTGLSSESFQNINLLENWLAGEQYKTNMENGRGQFPTSIFLHKQSDGTIEPNKKFVSNNDVKSRFPHQGNSIEENYENMLTWLKQRGFSLLARDNSFLGFPAFHLFIPGMSGVDERLFDVMDVLPQGDKYYEIKPEYRLKTITKAEALQLIKVYKEYKFTTIRLFDYCNAGFNLFNRDLLLALLSFFVGNYSDASLFMDRFLCSSLKSGRRQSSYYYCVRDFFSIQSSHNNSIEILSILKEIYGESLAQEVVNDMSDASHVFSSFPIPNGFECPHCQVKSNCSFNLAVEFEKIIQNVQISSSI